MLKEKAQFITGFGSVPAQIGTLLSSYSVNLLNMPYSNYLHAQILETPKIASMAFTSFNTIRVAVAEFGFFQSSNALVFDLDIVSGTVFILSNYLFDESVTDRQLFSVKVLPNGEVIFAGTQNGIPFLMRWDSHFGPPVLYSHPVCSPPHGPTQPSFGFCLPVAHRTIDHFPGSYALIQNDGDDLIAFVQLPYQDYPLPETWTYGFARFNGADLSLMNISSIGASIPSLFEVGRSCGGLVGQTSDSFYIQFVGERKGICEQHHSSHRHHYHRGSGLFLDMIVRQIDRSSLEPIAENNFGGEFGGFMGRNDGDVSQAVSCCPIDSLNNIVFLSDSVGLYQSSKHIRKINNHKPLACIYQSGILYSLDLTRQGLVLASYSV